MSLDRRSQRCILRCGYARIHLPSMRPVLSLDLACSGCNRSSLVLTFSLTMLISIEGMDDFCIKQLHPQGLCRLTLPSMARRLSRRYADGMLTVTAASGTMAGCFLYSVGTMRSGGTMPEKRCAGSTLTVVTVLMSPMYKA